METQHTTPSTITKDDILDDLLRFVNRRTGINIRDYAKSCADKDGVSAFRTTYREILRDGRDARKLIRACRYLVPFGILLLQGRTRDRLTYTDRGWDYCAGQYWCTEYRAAACRYLSRCYRDALMSQGMTGEQVKQRAKRELGIGIVRRWFS